MSWPRAAWICLPLWLLAAGCSSPKQPSSAVPAEKEQAAPVRITLFYASAPNLPRGEQELICYGVENATAVKLTPSKHDLAPALSRCVDESPAATTTYTLTAQGADGKSVSQSLTVTVGAPMAKIVEVVVSALNIQRGDPVSVCYQVSNAVSVTVEPVHYRAGASGKECVADRPAKTTTYLVTATGVSGDRDQERVTVQVR